LYYDGQLVSYPNLIAAQLKLVGGGEFKQPLVSMSSVGFGSSGNSRYSLGYKTDCKGVNSLSPGYTAGDVSVFASVAPSGPFNNMGVPGAKSFHVPAPGYGMANPFFGRMTTNPSTATILGDAASQNATFFSIFIGNNDVLTYALAGGAADSITAPPYFSAVMDLIVGTMTAKGAKGILGNIPDVTNIPYFTTVPYNGLTLDATQAAGLSAAYAPLGISFSAGSNAFIIADPSALGGKRKIKAGELVLLSIPQDSLKCAGWGSLKAIPNQYVLTETEIADIRTAVVAYNAKIKSLADAKGLAFVDVNDFMARVKGGIVYNGIALSTTFVSGGAFSLDGVHLTPIGNAMLANEFIKAINAKYGSTVPQVDATKYKGVTFP
jgi:hypothetical protein